MISASWVSVSICLSLFGSFLPPLLQIWCFPYIAKRKNLRVFVSLWKAEWHPRASRLGRTAWVNPWLKLSSHGINQEKVTGCKSWHCFFWFCMAWIWLAQYTSLLGLSSSPSALFSATNIHCPFSPSICFLRAHYIIKAIKQ